MSEMLLISFFGPHLARIVLDYAAFVIFVFQKNGYWIVHDIDKEWLFVPSDQINSPHSTTALRAYWYMVTFPSSELFPPYIFRPQSAISGAPGRCLYMTGGEVLIGHMEHRASNQLHKIGQHANCKNTFYRIEQAQMMFARKKHTLLWPMEDRYLYAIGGECDENYVLTIERFDTVYNKWEILAPLHCGLIWPTAVFAEGKIYVFQQSMLQIYDCVNNTWRSRNTIGAIPPRASAVYWNNKIYFFAANAGWIRSPLMYNVYDPQMEEWSNFKDQSVGAIGAIVV
jgi:hypothetical protein